MTHPSHTFFFEIWRGGGGTDTQTCQLLWGPSLLSAPSPGTAVRAHPRTGGHRGTLSPRPTRRGERAEPPRGGKERGRAGAAAEGRGLPAPPLCCTAEAPSSRAAGPRGGSGRPRPPPPGHRLPAGPLHQPAGSSGRRPAHLRHPAPHGGMPPAPLPSRGTPPRPPLAARLLAPSPRPKGGCHGVTRPRRACFVWEVSLPQPLAEPGRAGAPAVPTQHCPWTPARCRRATAEVNGAAPRQPNQRRGSGGASPGSSQPAPSPTPPPPPGSPLLLFGEGRAAAAGGWNSPGKQPSPAPPRPSPRRGGGCGQTKLRRSGRGRRGSPRPPLPLRHSPREPRRRRRPAAGRLSGAASRRPGAGREEGGEGGMPAGETRRGPAVNPPGRAAAEEND